MLHAAATGADLATAAMSADWVLFNLKMQGRDVDYNDAWLSHSRVAALTTARQKAITVRFTAR